MRKKYHLALTGDERRAILEALIFKKNQLLDEGRYTDTVDELIIKGMKAKVKKVRIRGGLTMNTEITYTRQGDYLLPDLTLPEQDHREIGVCGERRRRYLMNHHKILYYNLLTSCKLHDHLADINEEATEMYDLLVRQLAEKEGVNEQLKSDNQMLWVQRMNNIRNRTLEIVTHEIICQ